MTRDELEVMLLDASDPDALKAALDAADTWMTANPGDLGIAAMTEQPARLLDAYEAGLLLDPTEAIP